MASASALPLCDLILEGRLDQGMVLEMRDYVGEVLQSGPVMILVDVTGVGQATASGIAGILELRRLARSRGGDLRLHGRSGAITAARTATQLTSVSRVYETRDDAIAPGSRPPAVPAPPSRRPQRPSPATAAQAPPPMHPSHWLEPAPPAPGDDLFRTGRHAGDPNPQ